MVSTERGLSDVWVYPRLVSCFHEPALFCVLAVGLARRQTQVFDYYMYRDFFNYSDTSCYFSWRDLGWMRVSLRNGLWLLSTCSSLCCGIGCGLKPEQSIPRVYRQSVL